MAVAVVLATNFQSGWDRWSDPAEAWLTDDQQRELALVRQALASSGEGRPVVFAIDTDATDRVRVYGFMKFSANVSRHALPHGYLDRGHVFLGSVEDLLAGRPTAGGSEAYREISEATLGDVRSAGGRPIVVVARSFNRTGSNQALFTGGEPPAGVLVVSGDGFHHRGARVFQRPIDRGASPLRPFVVAAGLALLSLVGVAAVKGLLLDAGIAEALGLAPALAMALLTCTGFVLLALVRAPLTTALAWAVVGVAAVAGGALWLGRARA